VTDALVVKTHRGKRVSMPYRTILPRATSTSPAPVHNVTVYQLQTCGKTGCQSCYQPSHSPGGSTCL